MDDDELGGYHEEGLEEESEFEVVEGVEVDAEDVCDQQDQTDVDGEGSY